MAESPLKNFCFPADNTVLTVPQPSQKVNFQPKKSEAANVVSVLLYKQAAKVP